jgi:hypothetical protein
MLNSILNSQQASNRSGAIDFPADLIFFLVSFRHWLYSSKREAAIPAYDRW